jgi:DNA-binding SARP family transcriptional activator
VAGQDAPRKPVLAAPFAARRAATELSELAAEYPGREGLAGLLMVALSRCGRRGDALAAFDRTRRALANELGLDPGPGLRDLQARVLADDPSLAGAAATA